MTKQEDLDRLRAGVAELAEARRVRARRQLEALGYNPASTWPGIRAQLRDAEVRGL